jgi:hypothetical protein
MLFLILNIFLHGLNLRRADAESSISLLPGKFLTHPPGRAAFELLNSVGKRTSWG